jgi:cold-inducible RNA-binding protein
VGKRLYIGNLSFNTSTEALRAALEAAGGTVTDLHLPTDRETGRPRGFGFAELASEEEARAVIEAMDGKDLDGRNLTVNEARERNRDGGGGGGGGGYGGGGGGGGRNRW